MNELRTNLIVCIIIALSLILCPVAAVGSEKNTDVTEGQATENAEKSYDESGGYIAVMSASTGDVEKIKLREYIIGSVAAEADAVYHSEALYCHFFLKLFGFLCCNFCEVFSATCVNNCS